MSRRRTELVAPGLAALLGLGTGACVDADAPPDLITTSQAAYVVSTDTVNFGTVVVGNYGFGDVDLEPSNLIVNDITSITDTGCDDVEIVFPDLSGTADVWRECIDDPLQPALALPPICAGDYIDHTLAIDLTYHPLVTGTMACSLFIESPQGNKTISITGTSVPTPHDIQVLSPSDGTLPLGQVPLNSASSPGTVMIRSVGSADLTLSAITLTGAGFAFSSGNTAPHAVAPNTNESFGITCTPTALGPITGQLTLTHDSDDVGERPTVIDLSCEGIDSNLIVDPSPAEFPLTRVGESSSLTLDLRAALPGTPVTFHEATITGVGLSVVSQPADGTTLSTIAGGTVELAFAPIADGDITGVLTVAHDGETREVSIIAPGRESKLTMSPAGALDFGPLCVGESGEQVVLLGNPGSAALELTDVTTDGPGFARELVTPTDFPYVLDAAGGNGASFRVTATPAEGAQVGSLTIASDLPGEPARTVALTATGMPAGVAATPAAVDFGEVTVGSSSDLQSIYLSNCVAGGLTVEAATITGADAGEFLVVQAPPSLTIEPSEAAGWIIQMQPSSAGTKTAAFEITYAGGSQVIQLTGTSELAAGDVRGTYYACSTSGGGATGGVVVLVAVGGALSRRRRARPAAR